MRIGIDYTAAVWQGAGIGRYTRELVEATIGQGNGHTFRLFYAAGGLDPASPYLGDLRRLCTAHPTVRAIPIPFSPRRLTQLWHRLRLPLPVELFTGQLDLLHAPDFTLPPTRARTLLTIHDLSFLILPQAFTPNFHRFLSRMVPRSLRRADHVLADSEATRRDLERLLRVDAQRVTVVYPGVSAAFRPLPPEACEPVRRHFGLPDTFFLFVSTISPRKNLVRLLEAFARVIDQGHWSSGTAAQPAWPAGIPILVIAGQRGWLYEEVFAAIEQLRLGDRVRVLDYVDDKDLPALYNLACASVYPSLYEGFGLPPLEALACGTPVVTADNSSLPEVVGDAAVLVDAESIDSIASGLMQVLADTSLRARLRAAGPERARTFTWDRAAQRLLQCYDELSRAPDRPTGRC